MANGPQFVTVFARLTDQSIALWERLAWQMRGAGFIPHSGRGNAVDTGQFDHWAAARYVLAVPATGPTTVVDTVRQLGALEPTHPEPGDAGDLYHALGMEIGARAQHLYKGEPPTGPLDAPDWLLTICLDPLSAWMTWTENGQPRRRDFAPPNGSQKRRSVVRRLTVIDRDLLNAAAELCADSLAHAAAQRKTAAFPKATAPRRSRETTPPMNKRGTTEISEVPQGRTKRAPAKPRRFVRSDYDRPDSTAGSRT